jgi:hypothetical protein
MASNKRSKNVKGVLDRFESGADLGPIEDRNEYDKRLNSLPPGEKELAQESARFADLCQYFERQRMDVPVEIIDQLGRASTLAIPGRVEAMKKLNQKLMEYLDNVGQDPGIRQ